MTTCSTAAASTSSPRRSSRGDARTPCTRTRTRSTGAAALRAVLQAGLLPGAAPDADVPVPLHGLPHRAVKAVGGLRVGDGRSAGLRPRAAAAAAAAARRAPAAAAVPLAGLERVDGADDRRQAVGAGCGRAGPAGSRRSRVRRRQRRRPAPCLGSNEVHPGVADGPGRLGDHPDDRDAERVRQRPVSSTTPCAR